MPKLGDYLGQLVSEVTMARVQADLEAVRVAELYAGHPLLKTFPIPRFRLPDIVITVPVAIQEVGEVPPGGPARGGVDVAKAGTAFNKVLGAEMKRAKISLTSNQAKNLKTNLNARMKTLAARAEVGGDPTLIAEELTKTAADFISATRAGQGEGAKETLGNLHKTVKAQTHAELLKLRTPPPRLAALVTTQEIREAGGPQNLTQLKLKISEDSFEWAVMDKDGEEVERLVPE